MIPSATLVLPYPQLKRQPQSEPRSVDEDSGDQLHSPKTVLTSLRERMVRFDVLGVFLGIPGLLILNYALTSANTNRWGSGQIIGTLVTAIVLLVLFLLRTYILEFVLPILQWKGGTKAPFPPHICLATQRPLNEEC